MITKNNKLIRVENSDITNGIFIIPENIISIRKYTFSHCLSLKTIILPQNIIEIGKGAFWNCYNLKKITLSDNITEIKKGVFYNCYNLKEIILSDNITEIKRIAFYHCGLQSKIGNYKAFKKGLQCLDMQYNPYEWNEIDGEMLNYENGLHYVINLFDIFNYYYGNLEEDLEIWEVEVGDIIINNDEDSTKATNKIKPIKKLSRLEIINILNNK